MPVDLSAIPLADLGDEGLELRGTLTNDIFALAEEDEIRQLDPVDYACRLVRDDDLVVVTGSLRTRFELACVRCLRRFPLTVELEAWVSEVEGRNGCIDLTEAIREDILLALPGYPRCDASDDGEPCPAAGKFEEAADEASANDEPEGKPGTWDALDAWKPRHPND